MRSSPKRMPRISSPAIQLAGLRLGVHPQRGDAGGEGLVLGRVALRLLALGLDQVRRGPLDEPRVGQLALRAVQLARGRGELVVEAPALDLRVDLLGDRAPTAIDRPSGSRVATRLGSAEASRRLDGVEGRDRGVGRRVHRQARPRRQVAARAEGAQRGHDLLHRGDLGLGVGVARAGRAAAGGGRPSGRSVPGMRAQHSSVTNGISGWASARSCSSAYPAISGVASPAFSSSRYQSQ